MYTILVTLALIANTLPRIVDLGTWVLMNGAKYSDIGRMCYYSGQALSFVLLILATQYPKSKPIFELALLLALSNLIDELFFDPTIFGKNEIVFAIILAIWTAYRTQKCHKN
jgi:hypothetical protein